MPEQSTVSPQTYLLRHVLEKSDGQNAFFKVSPLKASLFLPLPIRIDYQSFLNFHAALRVATHAPDLSEESREFLLDNIELNCDAAFDDVNSTEFQRLKKFKFNETLLDLELKANENV